MSDGVLSDFPTHFGESIPLFQPNGSLPPGDFAPSRHEFESRFVYTGDVSQRGRIYEGWNIHREELMRAGIPVRALQLVNGSYTTSKLSPGDVDVAVEVPVEYAVLRSIQPDHPILRLFRASYIRAIYHCDAYPIYSLPKNDPLYDCVTAEAIRYWSKWFGRDRAGNPKGRVWATTGGLA